MKFDASGRRGPSGFSLVELLVVIGIIAVLISILLPALKRVQWSANKVACLSNMRQAYLELAMYSNLNKFRVPSYYTWSDKSFSNAIWAVNSTSDVPALNTPAGAYGYLSNIGLLFANGQMKSPRVWYCPAETAAGLSFNNRPSNQWPPARWGEPGCPPTGIGYSNVNTVSAYGVRPYSPAPNNTGAPRMIQLNKLKNRTILAEPLSYGGYLRTRHQLGVNVMGADGAGKWVPQSAFNENWQQFLATRQNSWVLNDPADAPYSHNVKTLPLRGYWVDFDRY